MFRLKCVLWTSMLPVRDSWSVALVTHGAWGTAPAAQPSHCPALRLGRASSLELIYETSLRSLLVSKLILLSLEILWGLINNCMGASYFSGNTVQGWTETGLLFVGLCWFSNTVSLHNQGVTSLRFCMTWPVVDMQIEPLGTACDLQRLGGCFCGTHPC